MKNFKILAVLGFAMLALVGCKDEDLAPILTFDSSSKGAYPRLVKLNKGEFDLNNLGTSAYSYEVEFFSIDQGQNVTDYEIYVTFKGDQRLFKSYTQSDFTTNANGYQGIAVEIPLSELLTTFQLNAEDLEGGDTFIFNTVVKIPGFSFASSNSDADVADPNGAFRSYFDFLAKATCPLEDDRFSGAYTLTYLDGTGNGAFGPALGADGGTVTLNTVDGSTTRRQFVYPYLGAYESVMELDFTCTFIEIPRSSTGVGCGGTIFNTQDGNAKDAAFDFDDDSAVTFKIIEGLNDGGCSPPNTPHTVLLTKQ